MAIYLFNAIATAGLGAAIMNYTRNDQMRIRNEKTIKQYLFIVLLIWTAMYALRGTTGTDAGGYRMICKSIYSNGTSLAQRIAARRDFLFAVVEYIGSKVFKGSWVAGSAIYALFIYVPVLYVIRKESKDIQLSLLLYVLTLSAYSGYNGIKQALSMSFVLLAYYYGLKKRKFIKYILLMVIAYGFHAAAIIVVPFHILSMRRNLMSFSTLVIFSGLLVGTIVISNFTGLLSSAVNIFSETGLEQYLISSSHGSSPLRIIVALFPIGLYLASRNSAAVDASLEQDVFMLVCQAIMTVYALSNMYYIRVAAYMGVMDIITYPKILNQCRNKKQLRSLIILLFFAYMLIFLLRGDSNLYPYIPVWRSNAW